MCIVATSPTYAFPGTDPALAFCGESVWPALCVVPTSVKPSLQGAHGGSVDVANPDGNLRSIYYARYVDWFFTTPLILLDVILMGNVALGATLW